VVREKEIQMSSVFRPTILLAVTAMLVGCGHAGAPNATLLTAPTTENAKIVSSGTASIVSSGSASIVSSGSASATTQTHGYVELEAPVTAEDFKQVDDPAALAEVTATDTTPVSPAPTATPTPPPYNVSDRVPYNVVVVDRSAHTATIAWHTEVPTKGLIEFGYTWQFDKHQFTDSMRDDVAKTDHQITLTNLSRFRSYTFKVTAITPLGLTFSDNTNRKFRTKFWAWR
jgi:hypothetical protein